MMSALDNVERSKLAFSTVSPVIIGLGSEMDPRAIKLATRGGTYIPNHRNDERAPESHRAAAEMFRESRPNAKLRSQTSVYNCVGLVFASRRTWVEIDELKMILSEDGYRKLENEAELWVGDVVVYEDDFRILTHVGVVIEVKSNLLSGERKVFVLSKWGRDGEYLHEMNDVHPLLGKPKTFWTERREVL